MEVCPNLKIFFVIFIFLYLNSVVDCDLKRNPESCVSDNECISGNCDKGHCSPAKCRSDKDCLKKGLGDHYCRDRGIKIFASECATKKGS